METFKISNIVERIPGNTEEKPLLELPQVERSSETLD